MITLEPLTRPYIEADLLLKPFLFLIRLSDNLDITQDRLNPMQSDEDFLIYLKHLSDNFSGLRDGLKEGTVSAEKREQFNEFKAESTKTKLKTLTTKNDIYYNTTKTLWDAADDKEYDFLYSQWVVDSFTLNYHNDTNTLQISIYFYDSSSLEEELKYYHPDNLYNKRRTLNQITRMEEACATLKNNGSLFNIEFILPQFKLYSNEYKKLIKGSIDHQIEELNKPLKSQVPPKVPPLPTTK